MEPIKTEEENVDLEFDNFGHKIYERVPNDNNNKWDKWVLSLAAFKGNSFIMDKTEKGVVVSIDPVTGKKINEVDLEGIKS